MLNLYIINFYNFRIFGNFKVGFSSFGNFLNITIEQLNPNHLVSAVFMANKYKSEHYRTIQTSSSLEMLKDKSTIKSR